MGSKTKPATLHADVLNRTDLLALDRTRLANERTFLAYFRTFIVFLGTGFAILRMEALNEIQDVGWILVFVAPVLCFIGWGRYIYTKRRLRKYYLKEYQELLLDRH